MGLPVSVHWPLASMTILLLPLPSLPYDLVNHQDKVAIIFAGHSAQDEEPAVGVVGPDREVHAAVGVDDLHDFADTGAGEVIGTRDEGLTFAPHGEDGVRIGALDGGRRDEQETRQQGQGFHRLSGVW